MIIAGQKQVLWDGSNVASKTYTYGNGWVSSKYNSVGVQYRCATLTASWVTIRIEGRYDSGSREASVYSERITAVQTIDKLANVVLDIGQVRAGVICSPVSATPNNVYIDLLLYDVK